MALTSAGAMALTSAPQFAGAIATRYGDLIVLLGRCPFIWVAAAADMCGLVTSAASLTLKCYESLRTAEALQADGGYIAYAKAADRHIAQYNAASTSYMEEVRPITMVARQWLVDTSDVLMHIGVVFTQLYAAAALPAPEPESAFVWAAGEAERVALFPIRHPEVWAYRKTLEALHWSAQEIDLTRDKKDWDTRMTPDQRHFVKMQLAFFATIDIDVLKNLDENFGDEVDCVEARMVYAAQKDQECTHAESYSLQIEAVMSGAEREAVLNAARTMPVIARMRDWVMRWFDRRAHGVGERLVAFAAVEGVLFSASFSALQWLRELNLLPGITDFNSFIVRDEGIHTLFTCHLVRAHLRAKPPQAAAEAIFGEVVAVLDSFVSESLPVRLIGMNDELMAQYVRFQADAVLKRMGYAPLYGVENPFTFMDKLALNEVAKSNFFEVASTQYQNVSRAGQAALGVDDSEVTY